MANTGNRNTTAFWLAMISAFFLFISGTTGSENILKIEHIFSQYLNIPFQNTLFLFLLIIASTGAFAVFVGGIMILKQKRIFGKIFIFLGSGAGIISFIVNLFASLFGSGLSIYAYLSYSSLGVFFAILAQIFSSKIKDKFK